MKKLIGLVLCVALLAIACVACSSGSGSASGTASGSSNAVSAASAEAQKLEITDSAYVVDDHGYIHYALEVKNLSTSSFANFPSIAVVGKTADGKIRCSDNWTLSSIAPGSTTYWASQAGNGNVAADDTIEISVSVSDRNWKNAAGASAEGLYQIENVSVEPDMFGMLRATGEITVTRDEKMGMSGVKQPMITCILRNGDGKIVGGFNGYVMSELTVGTPTAFEIGAYFDLPEYATAELYANPW